MSAARGARASPVSFRAAPKKAHPEGLTHTLARSKPRGREQLPIESSLHSAHLPRGAFPPAAAARRLVARLSAKHALFIPAGWWHEVFSGPRPSAAYNVWLHAHPRTALRPSLLYLRSERFWRFWLASDDARADTASVSESDGGDVETADDLEVAGHARRKRRTMSSGQGRGRPYDKKIRY